MLSEIIIPNMGANIEDGKIVEWYVKEGEPVTLGTPLFTLETTKGTFDIEAETDGIVLKILHSDGQYPSLTVVGYIGDAGDALPA